MLFITEVKLFNPSAAVPPTWLIILPSPKGMHEAKVLTVEVDKNESKLAVL